jgi:hypothetical protein
MSNDADNVEIHDDGFKIRKKIDFRPDMITTQQEAMVKTVARYTQRDNPLEQLIENVAVKTIDAVLAINEKIVGAIPTEQRLKLQKTWQDVMLAF